MSEERLNWVAVGEAVEHVRELKTAGVCMCATLGAPCWACRLDAVEKGLLGLLRESGFSARVYGVYRRACDGVGQAPDEDERWSQQVQGRRLAPAISPQPRGQPSSRGRKSPPRNE